MARRFFRDQCDAQIEKRKLLLMRTREGKRLKVNRKCLIDVPTMDGAEDKMIGKECACARVVGPIASALLGGQR